MTKGKSLVDNLTFSFHHFADDLHPIRPGSLQLTRYHRYRELGSPSSFGPGVYSSYDIQLQFFFGSTGTSPVRLLDPTRMYPVPLVAGSYGSQIAMLDNLFHSFKYVRILDDNGDPTGPTWDPFTWEEITSATLHTWSGETLEFEVIHPDPPGTYGYSNVPTDPLYGRLKSITSAQGYSTTLTYKTFSQMELQSDPALQFQIDTITDMYGKSISLTYTDDPVGGWYAVEEVTVPEQGTIAYEYDNNLLSQITGLDGEVSTFISSYNSTAQTTVMSIHDKAATESHRKKSVYLTDQEGASGVGGIQLFPSSTLLARMIVNGAGETSYFNSTAGMFYKQQVYEGGGRLKFANSDDPREVKHYLADWDLATTGDAIAEGTTETLGDTYEFVTGDDYHAGAPTASISPDGTRVNYLYDSNYTITHKIYSDGTWESFCYNDNKQVTRYRDRLARVTLNTYNAAGNLLVKEVGLVENTPDLIIDPYTTSGPSPCAEDDIQTADYATYENEYYGDMESHTNLLKKSIDPNGNETEYEYDTDHRLSKIISPPDVPMGDRAETSFEYDAAGRLSLVANAVGDETAYEYDARSRVTKITYEDGSTERYFYGTGDDANLLVKQVDRRNVVTAYEYDDAGRRTKVIRASATMDAMGTETAITDPAIKTETVYEYRPGCDLVAKVISSGEATEYTYDYRHRVETTKVYPNTTTELVTTNTYVDNHLFKTEDPYGRVTYYAYDATDGRLIRTIQTTVPGIVYTDFEDVLEEVRLAEDTPNPTSIITDILYDAEGQAIENVDPRGFSHTSEFDSRGRSTAQVRADGEAVEARSETLYDDASNVIEVRTPRYFDTMDTNGEGNSRSQMTYTGRNLLKTRTEADGTAVEATESFTYDLMGRQASHTDFRGYTWTTSYPSCCGHEVLSLNPLGHGKITHAIRTGQPGHIIESPDVMTITNRHNPSAASTFRESTMKYDLRGRLTAKTVWLTPQDLVDPEDPPIAAVNATTGLTTSYTYDDDLDDAAGLDSTFSSHFTGLGLGADCDGSAVLTTGPNGMRTLAIRDGAGRAIKTVRLDSTGSAMLSTVVAYDNVVTIAGYGDVVETTSTNQAGHITKRRTDAAGRTLEAVDGAGEITKFAYNSQGNRLSVRDPNDVGQDCDYDALGRDTQCTDTASNVTSRTYDLEGNVLTQTDAKSNSSSMEYDARGRRTKLTDRLGEDTLWTYDTAGNELSMTDAEGQTTTYTRGDWTGQVTETMWPDHVSGATVGQAGYGITKSEYDRIGRFRRKFDQSGNCDTWVLDRADRLTTISYQFVGNPTATWSDTFQYNSSGLTYAISGMYGNTVTRSYTNGLVAAERLTFNGQNYTIGLTYNFSVPKVTLTYPDGSTVERSLNSRGQLSTLKLGSTTVLSRTYDDGGRLLQQSLGNGIVEDLSYVADDNLPQTRETGVGDFSFTWDANKNKTGESITGGLSAYGWSTGTSGFDDADRLVARNQGSGGTQLNESWSLSAVGDMDSTTTNSVTTNRTHGDAHELTAIGMTAISSDIKGNLLGDGTGKTFAWDWNNQLKSSDLNADMTPDVTFTYDALRRRTSKTAGGTTTVFVSLGYDAIADYTSGATASSPLRNYVSTGRIDEPVVLVDKTAAGAVGAGTAELFYYHHDANWHVRGLTNSSGTVQELYAYSSYGTPKFLDSSGTVITSMSSPVTSSPLGNRFLFTAREWDPETATYHFRARTFSPAVNRFMNRDPLEYVDGANTYVGYLVPSSVDPTGLLSIKVEVASDGQFDFAADKTKQCENCYDYLWGVSFNLIVILDPTERLIEEMVAIPGASMTVTSGILVQELMIQVEEYPCSGQQNNSREHYQWEWFSRGEDFGLPLPSGAEPPGPIDFARDTHENNHENVTGVLETRRMRISMGRGIDINAPGKGWGLFSPLPFGPGDDPGMNEKAKEYRGGWPLPGANNLTWGFQVLCTTGDCKFIPGEGISQ